MRLWLVFVCMLLFYAECRGGNDFTNQRAFAFADFMQPPYHLGSLVRGVLQSNGDFIFAVIDPVNRKMIRTTNSGVTIKIGYLPIQTTTWTNSNLWTNMPNGFYQLKDFRAFKDDTMLQTAFANFWQPPHQLGTNVKGVCLPNGDFIFQVYDAVNRKMVKTTNSGETVKIGYLPVKSETWANSDTWINMPDGFYQVKGFQEKTTNLAVGKQATQWPNYQYYVPATYAVDGHTGTNYNTDKCTATSRGSTTRWWMVDLEKPTSIEKVTLFNRKDCCSERLNNAEVYVMDSPTELNKQVCGKVHYAQGKEKIDIPCTSGKLLGRYVRVEIPSGILTLCEVQVWGKEQFCAPQQLFAQDPGEVLSSADPSENMKKSFALQQKSGSSNFADVWEVKKKECVRDVACKRDFNQEDFVQNLDRAARGLAAGQDVAAALTYMKKTADLDGLLGIVGKFGPYLGGFGAVASMISAFGTSNEVQRLDHIIDQIDDGFKRMEVRFDKVEQQIEMLKSAILSLHLKTLSFDPQVFIDARTKDLKKYIDKCDGKKYHLTHGYINCLDHEKETCAKTCRKLIAETFKDRGFYDKLETAVEKLKNVMVGLGDNADYSDACSVLIKAVHDKTDDEKDDGRRAVIDRLMLIYRRILMGVINLSTVQEIDALHEKPVEKDIRPENIGKWAKHLEDVAKKMTECDVLMRDVIWVRSWKKDLDKVIGNFKNRLNEEKELADAIYNRLSGKYYWRHWLVFVDRYLDDNNDHHSRIQNDHSYTDVLEKKYRILVTSMPEDAPITAWFEDIAPMRRDLVTETKDWLGRTTTHRKAPAMGAKEIFDGLPTAAKAYPIAAVTLEGWSNCGYCHFGVRAPKERKFHQHFTSVCHDHQCGKINKWDPLWQTRRYQIVILG